MEGYLWLLLQTLPLITAAAVVFFILGWRWSTQDNRLKTQNLSQLTGNENVAAETARRERDETKNLEEKVRQTLAQTQAELKESQDQQTLLQKEVLRLADALKQAQQNIVSLSPVQPPTLKTETTLLLEQERQALIQARQELDQERATLHAAQEIWRTEQAAKIAPQPTPVAKKTRATKTAATKTSPKTKKPRTKKSEESAS
ncbi:hypothetical protein [Prosthecobacter dejongeii]|uniref:ElaB/YqjD/DUF883 family membrane-anchored ribosome-binding protein n=1 Tax=Prosthecobacter dejongeii TaxID=48465 RepID=A0A7W8DSA1_9BACT|nr:hypothetical protein [Prosthecobacter dejongeii]MBB5040428.1 ElaB/YqjD/DUF883 family membrane-anchored ribosome-binding protein [Prosthecobacter dejongeii]